MCFAHAGSSIWTSWPRRGHFAWLSKCSVFGEKVWFFIEYKQKVIFFSLLHNPFGTLREDIQTSASIWPISGRIVMRVVILPWKSPPSYLYCLYWTGRGRRNCLIRKSYPGQAAQHSHGIPTYEKMRFLIYRDTECSGTAYTQAVSVTFVETGNGHTLPRWHRFCYVPFDLADSSFALSLSCWASFLLPSFW